MKLTPHAQTAIGLALMGLGAWYVHEAWEGHGRPRPWLLRFVPG